MRFWLLTSEYPPFSGGGISTYASHTARMFSQFGHEVTVFTPARRSGRTTVTSNEGIRVIGFPASTRWTRGFLGWEASVSYQASVILKQFADAEGEPDFLESQDYNGIGYYLFQRHLLEEKYFSNTQCFATTHAPGFLYLDYNQTPCFELPQYWTGEMEKAVLRSAPFVISPSRYLIDELARYIKIDDLNITQVFNPFDGFAKAPGPIDRGEIVFFGKLIPQKGILELLSNLKSMWDEGFSGRLRIVGGGDHFFFPMLANMSKHVARKYKSYIERGMIVMDGHISPEGLKEKLFRAHVIVIPSIVDNLPYTVVESMAMGKVVLVSESGGHKELITHGKTGFIFSHEVKNSFQDNLRSIMNMSEDALRQIGAHATEHVRSKCAYETVYMEKLGLLEKCRAQAVPRTRFPYVRPRKQTTRPNGNKVPGLLSVVIPFHNLEKYVEESVRSVFLSDYNPIELIIVNDRSEAQSVAILPLLREKYKATVVDNEEPGLCNARNSGADMAKGEFLAFLDADDKVEPTYYSKAVAVLKRFENVHFVGCWASYFGENEGIWPSFNPEPPYLLTHNMINSSALVYKTSSFLATGLHDPKMLYGMEDYESVISMTEKGCQGIVIPEVLWHYRIRRHSMAQSFNRYSELYLYRLISRKHGAYFNEFAEEIVNLLNANGPGINYDNPTMPILGHGKHSSTLTSRLINTVYRSRLLRRIVKKILSLV